MDDGRWDVGYRTVGDMGSRQQYEVGHGALVMNAIFGHTYHRQ